MADVNRLPVDSLVLHHAVTPLWSEKSKAQLAQWFSDNGFSRAYGSNEANWSGLINPYTGARSYSQAHLAGQQVNSSTPDATQAERDAGYRLVPLVSDIWGQICWHAGNWEMNRRSIGIENLGDYRNYTLRDGDCKVIAAFWRTQDLKMGGKTAIYGHSEVSDAATSCPARIMEMRGKIVDYCNNPPTPVVTTKTESVTTVIPFTKTSVEDPTSKTTSITTVGVDGKRVITYTITLTDGKETGRVVKSDTTTPPIAEVTTIGTYVEPVVPENPVVDDDPVDTELAKDTNTKVTGILGIVTEILKWVKTIWGLVMNLFKRS